MFGLAMIVIEVPVALLLMQPCPERTDDLPCGLNGNPDAHAPGAQDPEANIPLGELKRQPFFYIYLIGMLSVSFVGYGSLAHLSIHLTDVYNPAFSNALISFFLLLLTPAKICLGWMYDRMGAKIANIVVMSFHAVSFLQRNRGALRGHGGSLRHERLRDNLRLCL